MEGLKSLNDLELNWHLVISNAVKRSLNNLNNHQSPPHAGEDALRLYKLNLYNSLSAPEKRLFFEIIKAEKNSEQLHNWLNSENEKQQDFYKFAETYNPSSNEYLIWIFKLHISLALAKLTKTDETKLNENDYIMTAWSGNTCQDLQEQNNRTAFVKDLYRELTDNQQEPIDTQCIKLLLVQDNSGGLATLSIELFKGNGALYPHPKMAFIPRDSEFCKGLKNAIDYSNFNQHQFNARWSIEKTTANETLDIPMLMGKSASAAFCITLGVLLARTLR